MITNPGQVSGTDSALDRVFGPVGRTWDRLIAPTERYRRPFRRWRRGRPFTAGISILLAGVEISLVTQSAVGKLLSMGIPGISTIFISVFLVIFAVTIWFFPAYRVFSGIAAIMIALLSLIATNLGGFLLGFLLAMFGGAFAVAWTPRAEYTADTRRQRRAARRTAPADQGSAAPAAETAQAVALSTAVVEAETPAHDGAAADEAGSAEAADEAGSAGETEPTAEPAAAREAADDPEYARNTRVIEHYARPDEAAEAPPEPAPEED